MKNYRIFNFLKKKNNGAAMISVLIAITFISIIASSLLYMTYINYLTKSTRVFSTDNFYSDEFVLDEITSRLQQYCKTDYTTGVNLNDIKDARMSIRAAVGSSVTGDAKGTGTYNPANLKALVSIASSDLDGTTGIEVTAPDGAVYEEIGDYIKIKNVNIKAKSKEKYAGDKDTKYLSEIQTDIVLYLPEDNAGGPDINDFSIITDQKLNTIADAGDRSGNIIWTGHVYIKGETGYGTDPSKYAVLVNGGRCVSMLSGLGAIDGDLVITNQSAMSISGKCIVDGDIYVGKNSCLTITGDLYLTGTVHCGRPAQDSSNVDSSVSIVTYETNGSVRGLGNIIHTDEHLPNHNVANKGMTADVFADHLFVYNGSSFVDTCDSSKTDFERLPVHNLMKDLDKHESYTTNFSGNVNYLDGNNFKSDSFEYRNRFNTGNLQVANGGTEFFNNLYFVDFSKYKSDSTRYTHVIKKDMLNSTILGLTPITYYERSSSQLTKLPAVGYKYCKEQLNMTKWDFSGSAKLEGKDLNGDGKSNFNDIKFALSKIKGGTPGTYKAYVYDSISADTSLCKEVTQTDLASVDIDSLSVDDQIRYVVYDGSNNLVPDGYFLNPKSKSVIADYFRIINTVDNEPKPEAHYENWEKK